MRMTKLATLLSFVLAAGMAYAQDPQPPAQQPPAQEPAAKPMPEQATPDKGMPEKSTTKELAAQVVSTDAGAKTITVKKEGAAAETTFPVEAAAVAALKTVSAGEKVKLVCKTDSNGKETAVTDIKKADKSKDKSPY